MADDVDDDLAGAEHGSAAFSITSGDPKDLSTAAFMMFTSVSHGVKRHMRPPLKDKKTWYYPSIAKPSIVGHAMADPRRKVEFGDFLRSRREKLTPKTVGLAARAAAAANARGCAARRSPNSPASASTGTSGSSRAAPSARRCDGRCAGACAAARQGRARASAGADARRRPPRVHARGPCRRRSGAPVESLNLPAYVTGRRWDVLAWNEAAEEIFALQPVAGGGSQHAASDADQPRDAKTVRRGLGGEAPAHGSRIPRHP